MRHVYFKDARDAEIKAIGQMHPPTETQHQPPVNLEIAVPQKSNVPKVQQPKALPSLVLHDTQESEPVVQNKQVTSILMKHL